MKFLRTFSSTAGVLVTCLLAMPALGAPTSPLDFAQLYVRQISSLDHFRQEAQLSAGSGNMRMADCIRDMTSLQIEYNAQAVVMRTVVLEGEAADFPSSLAGFWSEKAKLYSMFSDACSAMMAGPKPGIDYGDLVATLPKLTASINAADRAILDASPLVFAVLIDTRADREGRANHLVISNRERAELVKTIDDRFGPELKGKDVPTLVASVGVLRDYLATKGFKGSDDPW